MKIMSLLARLIRLMDGFRNNRLCVLFERCWRPGAGLWRWIAGLLALVGYRLAAIRWRKDAERKQTQEFEISDDEEAGAPQQVVCEAACTVDTLGHAAVGEEEEEDEDSYRADPTDEFYCEYDSTWETDDENHDFRSVRRPSTRRSYNFRRFESAARDMQNYRHKCPHQSKHECWSTPGFPHVQDDMPNLKFYLGLLPSQPDEVYISTFHRDWFGDYDALEHVHTYIQWLFPLQEPGVNFEASPLTEEEIKMFRESCTARGNLLKSYRLMLDFYGIELCNETTGEVKKAPKWKERFDNLNTHTHNNLRITRILKCLGMLGYRHYQRHLVRFFLEETLVHQQLPNVRDSVLNYFVFAVLDKKQRRKLIKFAFKNYGNDDFVWCQRNIQMKWARSIYV